MEPPLIHRDRDDGVFVPLQLSEIVGGVVHVYRRNAWRLVAIAFVAQLLVFIVTLAAGEPTLFGDTAEDEAPQAGTEAEDTADLTTDLLGGAGDVVVEETSGTTSDASDVLDELSDDWLSAVVVAVVAWVAFTVSEAAITWVALESQMNLRAPLEVTLKRALTRLWPLTLTVLVISLMVLVVVVVALALSLVIGSLAVFVGVVAGVYLVGRLLFAPIVALIQRTGPSDSINESFRMTRGNWWRVVGYVLLMALFYLVVGAALQYTVGQIPNVGDLIVGTVMVPPSIIFMTILYLDLRARTSPPDAFTRQVLAGEMGLTKSGSRHGSPP